MAVGKGVGDWGADGGVAVGIDAAAGIDVAVGVGSDPPQAANKRRENNTVTTLFIGYIISISNQIVTTPGTSSDNLGDNLGGHMAGF